MSENPFIVITFPSPKLFRIKQLFHENESIQWLYFGKQFLKRRSIAQELGNRFKYIDITKLLNEVANDIRLDHVHWVDSLNQKYGNILEWWFGVVSSRNIYNSNLFQYSCYIEILERLWKDLEYPVLIITESYGLSEALRIWTCKKGIKVDMVGHRQSKLILAFYPALSLLYFLNNMMILFLRWICAKVTRIKYGKKHLSGKNYVLIDTFLHDYSLSEDGAFKERYFPYLGDYFAKKGVNIIVHPVLYGFHFNFYSVYRRMRISDVNFIIAEDYLRFSDYFYVLKCFFKIMQIKIETPYFRAGNISSFVKDEHKKQRVSPIMQAALIYRLFLRLGKSGLQLNQVINWYENQVIDRALIAGVRKAFPNAKIVGAQMFIHSPNFLSLFPCQSEVNAGITPDVLLETSEHQCQIAQLFTKDIPCKAAAALRYTHLFNGENLLMPVSKDDKKVILVLLPFDIDEAVEFLKVLNEALSIINKGVVFWIKGHPDYSPEEIVNSFGKNEWPISFELCQMNLNAVLDKTSIAISSNSSSMVEAAARGIPVIFLGRQTVLNHNMLSNLNMEIVTECFSVTEVVNAINKYLYSLHNKTCDYKKMGDTVRDLFFTPLNEITMAPFLESCQQTKSN